MEEYKKLFKSFVYAFNGVCYVIRHERNFRIHLCCLAYMFSFLCFTDWFTLSRSDWAILMLTSGTVLACELINTAVENAVNLASDKKTAYGKIAKDAAAGAVLISAFFAVITGVMILLQKDAFISLYRYFSEHIGMFILFVLSIVPATVFIFWGIPFSKRK